MHKKIKISSKDKLHPVDVFETHVRLGDEIIFEIDEDDAGKIEIASLLFGPDDPLMLDTFSNKKSVSFKISNEPYIHPGAVFTYKILSANIPPPNEDPKIVIGGDAVG